MTNKETIQDFLKKDLGIKKNIDEFSDKLLKKVNLYPDAIVTGKQIGRAHV